MEAELLLSQLQSCGGGGDLADIDNRFVDFLHPLVEFHDSGPDFATPSRRRKLTKQFLSFLNKVLSLLPKRLSQISIPDRIASALFDVYKLCLDCLDLISPELACKPYSVHAHTARYMQCLEARELYREAVEEGYSVLDSLGRLDQESTPDGDLALLRVQILVTMLKCTSLAQSREEHHYRKLLLLLDEARPWLRVLDADTEQEMQTLVVTYLSRINYYLVAESKCYSRELMLKFCTTTFCEHDRSYLKVQMHKFARRICSHLLSQEDDQNSNIIGILRLVLDSMATECKASLSFVEKIISANWTQANGLKYIFVSLYNNAVILFKAKRTLEASEVLEIACRASWKSVIIICQVLVERGSKCEDGLSGDAAADLCNEAFAKTAFLLDLHSQESHFEVERVVKDCLKNWFVAKTLLEELPSPVALVRKWVKIQCGYLRDEAVHERAGNLYSLLSSSVKISQRILGILMEQGFMDLHIDIYKIMIQKLLVVLWKSRRLSHPLCPSPVDPKFITEACKNHDELNKLRYWIKCMEESHPHIVGFEQCFLSMLEVSSLSSNNHDSAIQSDLTEEKITQAAAGLISSVPVSSESMFMAGYLYYDLCDRLIQSGQMVEVKHFDVRGSVATEACFRGGMSCDIEGFIVTPWNILQCYLESTLQEGTIHENLGNRSEAETLLLWGKSISCFKSLPVFVVSFSTILGKLYRKHRLWNLADIELKGARAVLTQNSVTISCLWCKSVLEVTISEQLGHLHRNRCCNGAEGPSFESISKAIDIYKSVLINLNSDQNKTTANCPGLASTEMIKGHYDNLTSDEGKKADVFPSKGCRVKTEKVCTRQSKVKNEKKVHNFRKTRSRHHNLQNNNGILQSDISIDLTTGSNNVDLPSCSQEQSRPNLETKCLVADILLEVAHLFDKIKCLHCLLLDIHSSNSLSKFVGMRWELARRRLLLRSLISIAKSLRVCGNIHEARETLLQSLLLLINRNTCLQYSSCPVTTLFDLIGEGYPRNILTIEGASLLYHICWLSLKRCHCNNTSQFCSELASIERSRILSWLRMVFILSHEVPIFSQKVSRLLAALYIVDSPVKPFALPCKGLSVSHWASFFNQAAIGTHHNQQLDSRIDPNGKCEGLKEAKNCNVCNSIVSVLGKAKQSSLVPVTEKDFNQVVLNFFRNLPSVRVICISCIGGADGDLLRELLYYPSSVQAWLLLSRLNSDNHPVSVLLPASLLAEESSYDGNSSPFMRKSVVKKWRCPWVSSVVDDVAPTFKLILEENYVSSSAQLDGNTKRSKLAWWTKRMELDERLGDFLQNMEQSWLGPFKYLLSEEWPDFRNLNSLQKKVLDELGYDGEGDDCQRISKKSPGNARYSLDKDNCVLQIILNGGFCVYKPRNTLTEVESAFTSFLKPLSDTNELVEFECNRTKPVMLVLDYEVQMLPWESLPVLKSQEVYRMPSLYSISITLDRCSELQDKGVRAPTIFPRIDPLNSYYVLNPGGDLSYTQIAFENWFKDQHFEGITGSAPPVEELISALKSHDLFIYLGHGSGSQYFPGHHIKKVERCSGTVLMGCSSGSLSLKGPYAAEGASLCYLLAGSPVVIANLWEVTDKDIDRFGKAMLDAWLEERSKVAEDIDECGVMTKQMKSMSIRSRTRGDGRKERKEVSDEESGEKHAADSESRNQRPKIENQRPKIGSFIGQARQACKLPFLIGASPVCYGVPTGITKKQKINKLER